jgi:hypothetical protein
MVRTTVAAYLFTAVRNRALELIGSIGGATNDTLRTGRVGQVVLTIGGKTKVPIGSLRSMSKSPPSLRAARPEPCAVM